VTLDIKDKLNSIFNLSSFKDISKDLMNLRMIKSHEEIDIIKNGARIADLGAEEIVKNIKVGESELEIAIAGRDRMEREIAITYPEAEYMDTWVWFQSGINTDGAHNPKTNRKIKSGDILSLNTFPMISGYYTALERTLFVEQVDDASLKAWEANVKVHKKGLELIKPGAKCSEICEELNDLFAQLGYLQYRTFGYGHSFGMLSHFYGREAGLELREDIDTILQENMVISMEPMIMIPEGKPGAGGYREHDILVIKENGVENITKFPFGPEKNVIKN
jgi:creatinase